MSVTKLEIGADLWMEYWKWDSCEDDVSFNYIEHSPDSWYSAQETEVLINKEKATEIVSFLTKAFNLGEEV